MHKMIPLSILTALTIHQELDGDTGLPSNPQNLNAPPASNPSPAQTQTPAPSGQFSQEQLDAIVGDRIGRERRKYESRLEELGFKSFDDIKALVDAQKQQETNKLKEQNKFKELYEKAQDEYNQKISALEGQLQSFQSKQRDMQTQNLLLSSLSGSVNPQQAAQIAKSRISYDDEGNPYPTDEQGKAMINAQGQPMSVQEFGALWLDQNPHFKKAASGRGAITPDGPGSVPDMDTLDPARMNDPDYILKHRDVLMRDLPQ